MKAGLYQTWGAFEGDVLLMVNNAREYNIQGSLVYQDAAALESAFLHHNATASVDQPAKPKSKPTVEVASTIASQAPRSKEKNSKQPHPSRDKGSVPPAANRKAILRSIAAAWNMLRRLTDEDGRRLADMFLELPDREDHPDYFATIKSPICLNDIANTINIGLYQTWDAFEGDVLLMVKNARQYNRPDLLVYQDATALESAYRQHVARTEPAQAPPMKSHPKINRPSTAGFPQKRPRQDKQLDSDQPRKKMTQLLHEGQPRQGERIHDWGAERVEGAMPGEESGEGEEARSRHTKEDPQALVYARKNESHKSEQWRNEEQSKRGEKIRKGKQQLQFLLQHHGEQGQKAPTQEQGGPPQRQQSRPRLPRLPHTEQPLPVSILGPSHSQHSPQWQQWRQWQHERHHQQLPISPQQQFPNTVHALGNRSDHLGTSLSAAWGSMRQLTDAAGRNIADQFMHLPDQEDYPDYFALIKSPICLNEIGKRMKAGLYQTWGAFEGDVLLMVNNAREYNIQGSHVYQDAAALESAFRQHKAAVSASAIQRQSSSIVSPSSLTALASADSKELHHARPVAAPAQPPVRVSDAVSNAVASWKAEQNARVSPRPIPAPKSGGNLSPIARPFHLFPTTSAVMRTGQSAPHLAPIPSSDGQLPQNERHAPRHAESEVTRAHEDDLMPRSPNADIRGNLKFQYSPVVRGGYY
jgi:hypothetical protein